MEVEGLEIGKGKAVLGVVKEKAVLAAVRPAVQTLFQFANDIGEVGKSALLGVKNVHALDPIPQLALLLEVHAIALSVALNQHTEE